MFVCCQLTLCQWTENNLIRLLRQLDSWIKLVERDEELINICLVLYDVLGSKKMYKI